MYITSWRYVNDVRQMSINKESYWLTLMLLHLEVRSRSHDVKLLCIEKYKQLEMVVSYKATTLRFTSIIVNNIIDPDKNSIDPDNNIINGSITANQSN